MEVRVKAVKQYGRWVYYPLDPNSAAFAEIANTATLTEHTMKYVKLLGFDVVVELDSPAIHAGMER